MAVTKITITRSVEGLLRQADATLEEDEVNEEGTVERWVELLQAELQEQFPGADIQIRTRQASPAGLDVVVVADDDEEQRSARDKAARIGERLLAGDDWIVPEVGA